MHGMKEQVSLMEYGSQLCYPQVLRYTKVLRNLFFEHKMYFWEEKFAGRQTFL